MKSISGNKPMRIDFRNSEEGVINLKSLSFSNQSNETRDPELDPILSIGRKAFKRISGNFIP